MSSVFQYYVSILFVFLISFSLKGQEKIPGDLWLSGEPSKAFEKAVKKSGMQKYYALPGKRGSESLILWLREGKDFQSNSYRTDSLKSNEYILSFSPDGKRDFYKFSKVRNLPYALTYPFKTEGYHNFFMISKEVKGDTLFVHTAKAERLSHKCREGHKKEVSRVKDVVYEEIPLQLARGRIDFEDFHLILQSGKDLELTALKYGTKLENARVELISQKGWNLK